MITLKERFDALKKMCKAPDKRNVSVEADINHIYNYLEKLTDLLDEAIDWDRANTNARNEDD